jgi:hypothetical protein
VEARSCSWMVAFYVAALDCEYLNMSAQISFYNENILLLLLRVFQLFFCIFYFQ